MSKWNHKPEDARRKLKFAEQISIFFYHRLIIPLRVTSIWDIAIWLQANSKIFWDLLVNKCLENRQSFLDKYWRFGRFEIWKVGIQTKNLWKKWWIWCFEIWKVGIQTENLWNKWWIWCFEIWKVRIWTIEIQKVGIQSKNLWKKWPIWGWGRKTWTWGYKLWCQLRITRWEKGTVGRQPMTDGRWRKDRQIFLGKYYYRLVVKQNYISLTNLGILRDMGAGTYLNMVGTIQKLCQFSLQVHDFYYMSL